MSFTDIKSGIWKLKLRGEYISSGRYDIWLPDKNLLPEGTKFLNPNPYNTLTIPSTARKVTIVAYYNSINNSILSSSGKGFNTNYLINPDIAANGVNWMIKDIKNVGIYSTKLRSSLIYSAKRDMVYNYPNEDIGYGKLDLLEVFNVLGGEYRGDKRYKEYYVNNLFVRFPID